MCFSATASFSAAAIIGGIGIATLKAKHHKNQNIFASIPFLFSAQQLCEGFIWLSFNNPQYESLRAPLTALFLVFAWAIWPIMLPLSIYHMEENIHKKALIKTLLIAGIIIGITSVYSILFSQPQAYIANFHIDYRLLDTNKSKMIMALDSVFYVVCTIIPMLISSLKNIRVFAIVNIMALLLSFTFYKQALPSTWCFFAAILSGCIYWLLKNNRSQKEILS
jgi:hypothetical protein